MRLAMYVRVSTQRQALPQTGEPHLERLRAWCTQQEWAWGDEWIVRDDGFSGATLQRPGRDARRDARRDAVAAARGDLVLLTAPDRRARNDVHPMVRLAAFERAGCRVAWRDRPLSPEPHDPVVRPIRGAVAEVAEVAEYDRTRIAERLRRGRLHTLPAGLLLPWSVPPSGYRLGAEPPRDPAGVWVEPLEGPMGQAIFRRSLDARMSLDGLANWLTAPGVPTPTGKAICLAWKHRPRGLEHPLRQRAGLGGTPRAATEPRTVLGAAAGRAGVDLPDEAPSRRLDPRGRHPRPGEPRTG